MAYFTVYYEIRYEVDANSEDEATEKADTMFNKMIGDCQDVQSLPDYTDHIDTMKQTELDD